MPRGLYLTIGILVAFVMFSSTLRDLLYAAPHIVDFEQLHDSDQRALLLSVSRISMQIYMLEPVLIAMIILTMFAIDKRSSVGTDLFFLGVFSGTVYVYLLERSLLDLLIPESGPSGLFGFGVILLCIATLHVHCRRMRVKR